MATAGIRLDVKCQRCEQSLTVYKRRNVVYTGVKNVSDNTNTHLNYSNRYLVDLYIFLTALLWWESLNSDDNQFYQNQQMSNHHSP